MGLQEVTGRTPGCVNIADQPVLQSFLAVTVARGSEPNLTFICNSLVSLVQTRAADSYLPILKDLVLGKVAKVAAY